MLVLLTKPLLVQVVTACSTAAIGATTDLVTGRPLTPVECDYRWSMILPSSA